ncbi:MAG TPA: hypothetical protein PKU78_01725 [Candidatus Dojkabacteria bacterium]|nr:hypothetical protein [Candidatus Dojkabacteria bacterium]HRO64917.1 hypothetical protein [Candidatus Dojkabacteria bacterium]HRP36733.1 hypothetical protein [Candidatus Dojkabacteria bacterium]HRP51297.1 hypothetical protein [Candidatus Dojkabacteria bacterium]
MGSRPEGPKQTEPKSQSSLDRITTRLAVLGVVMYTGSLIGEALAPEGCETFGSLIGAYTPAFLAFVGLLGNAWRNRNH